ncbi:MAG: L-threonylcarbamoyladenylate synthase, partial [Anaerolineae bacterium]|nr:L-threonylcarbamoyladenylate synthase [Anaerolineae bacterium]
LPEYTQTIERLYRIRKRKHEPALPLLISSSDHIKKYATPNQTALQLALHFWPGPLTLILPSVDKGAPVALRVPNTPLLKPVLVKAGGCLFTSGSILSGQSPAITAQEAAALFGDQVALILDGGASLYGLPSTIIDCTKHPPLLVRRGAVHEETINELLGNTTLDFIR